MKLWRKRDEWVHYANCLGSKDHTLPPRRKRDEKDKPVADASLVRGVCASCRVIPECIRWATDPAKPEGSVWVAGKWIPENRRQAARVRRELVLRLRSELDYRGEDV